MIRAGEAKDDRPSLWLVGISARSRGDEEALCLAAGMALLRKPVTGAMLAAEGFCRTGTRSLERMAGDVGQQFRGGIERQRFAVVQ